MYRLECKTNGFLQLSLFFAFEFFINVIHPNSKNSKKIENKHPVVVPQCQRETGTSLTIATTWKTRYTCCGCLSLPNAMSNKEQTGTSHYKPGICPPGTHTRVTLNTPHQFTKTAENHCTEGKVLRRIYVSLIKYPWLVRLNLAPPSTPLQIIEHNRWRNDQRCMFPSLGLAVAEQEATCDILVYLHANSSGNTSYHHYNARLGHENLKQNFKNIRENKSDYKKPGSV